MMILVVEHEMLLSKQQEGSGLDGSFVRNGMASSGKT